jgi:hypothetical protein
VSAPARRASVESLFRGFERRLPFDWSEIVGLQDMGAPRIPAATRKRFIGIRRRRPTANSTNGKYETLSTIAIAGLHGGTPGRQAFGNGKSGAGGREVLMEVYTSGRGRQPESPRHRRQGHSRRDRKQKPFLEYDRASLKVTPLGAEFLRFIVEPKAP